METCDWWKYYQKINTIFECFLTKKDHESGEKMTFMVVGDQISMIKVEDERGV